MKSRSAFEERLISHSSESTLKNAKQLLKKELISGAFRDANNVLHAVFTDSNSIKNHVHLDLTSGHERYQCDCPDAGGSEFCMHAIALWMYSSLFGLPNQGEQTTDEESASYVGLKNAGLDALAKDCSQPVTAQVFIKAESAFPHVPSKWENAVLSVRLRSEQREYLGNLDNLRKLFFDKAASPQMRFADFSLQDRQIIRFLAINGEAENSNVLLNSEMASELFHILGDFPRFYRNNRRVIIHNDTAAKAVVLSRVSGGKRMYSPGIEYKNALLEINSAKVITGKSGCWIGKNGEYFFIAGDCEVGFMRNFFRLGQWSAEMPGCAEFLKNMPFKLYKADQLEVANKPLNIVLSGRMQPDGLALQLSFVYDHLSFPPDAGRLAIDRQQNFFLRQELLESQITGNLRMLKVSGDIAKGSVVLEEPEKIGLFLDEMLPDWIKRYKNLAIGGELAQLANGGNQLEKVDLECTADSTINAQGCHLVKYLWRSRSGGRAAWHDIVQAAAGNASFIKLDNGRLARLTGHADIVKLNKLIKDLDENNHSFELPHMMLHYFRHLVRHWQGAVPAALGGYENVPAPAAAPERKAFSFNAQLRGYQQEGFEWMRKMLLNNLNVILADEMGLGKTIQALAVFNELHQYSNAPSLVICPASLVENWARECGKFIPDCRVGLLYGSERTAVAKNLRDYDLIITSYTMARRESAKLAKLSFDMLILDEAQHIKNPGTANAHSCKNLKASHKLVLTGTPLENSPEDLWSIFDFLHPNLLGSFNAFKKEYASINESESLRADLAARTAPFIKRRVKSADAPELPPREDINWFCTMDPVQRKLYEKVRTEGLQSLAKLEKDPAAAKRGNMEVLTTLLRLRQICCHPELVTGSAAGDSEEVESAKFDLLQELLLEHIDSGHKVLLFSQFTSLLAIIRKYLDSANIKYSYLDGATRNRQDVVDQFNNDPNIGVFLLSLKAGGTGLNLTSADTVIIYDPWWNPAVELQAADRTHRIGQTRPVRSIKLLVKDSIEEKILALQQRKQEIFDQVVENPAAAGEKFTIEDLKFLLS